MVDATIEGIHRGTIELDLNYLVQGRVMGSHDEPNPETDYSSIPIMNFVINHPEGTILWDTGVHHDALNGHLPEWLWQAFYFEDAHEHRLDDDLEEAGYAIDDIDYVFQSHLHPDHAGGLEFFDETETPVFVHEEELKHAYSEMRSDPHSPYMAADFDHDLNWQVLHRDRETRFKDIEFIHLPGHTPGMTGTMIHLPDETVILAGDQVYLAQNYTEEVPLGAGLLWSHRHWFRSLKLLNELERKHDAEIVYGHEPDQFETIKDGWG